MRYTTNLVLALGITLLSSFTSAAQKLIVTSPAFTYGASIPDKYSCDGLDTNPPLRIDNIPVGAKSLAIIIHDPDAQFAGGFTHWVAWDIDVRNDIPENFKGATSGVNSYIKHNYKGMCPPAGPHHYHFMVYALDTRLNLDLNTDKVMLQEKMHGHILAEGELVGTYARANSAAK